MKTFAISAIGALAVIAAFQLGRSTAPHGPAGNEKYEIRTIAGGVPIRIDKETGRAQLIKIEPAPFNPDAYLASPAPSAPGPFADLIPKGQAPSAAAFLDSR